MAEPLTLEVDLLEFGRLLRALRKQQDDYAALAAASTHFPGLAAHYRQEALRAEALCRKLIGDVPDIPLEDMPALARAA